MPVLVAGYSLTKLPCACCHYCSGFRIALPWAFRIGFWAKKLSEENEMLQKPLLRSIWDFIGIPFRMVLFDQAWLPRFGWTTLEEERLDVVLPRLRGRVLDVGAGTNTLINGYGNGVGVDVHDWGGGALVVEDT